MSIWLQYSGLDILGFVDTHHQMSPNVTCSRYNVMV